MEDLPGLTGRTVVVTGASAGIGAAAVRRLHALGATVVPVGRSPERTAAVAAELGVEGEVADFADLAAVRDLAARLLVRCPRIDVLAHNAGGRWSARRLTVDGHERTFQVDHLAPFLLTGLLRDRLAASAARVVTTSSDLSRYGRIDLADLDGAGRRYSPTRAYATAKLAALLVTRELARQAAGTGLTAAAFTPGLVATDLGRGAPPIEAATRRALRLVSRTAEHGADTLAWLAAAPPDRWRSGGWYRDRHEHRLPAAARDDRLARELWARSAELVGLDPTPAP